MLGTFPRSGSDRGCDAGRRTHQSDLWWPKASTWDEGLWEGRRKRVRGLKGLELYVHHIEVYGGFPFHSLIIEKVSLIISFGELILDNTSLNLGVSI